MARIEVRYGSGAGALGQGIAAGVQNYRRGQEYQRAVRAYTAGQEGNKILAELAQETGAGYGREDIDWDSFNQRMDFGKASPEYGRQFMADLQAAKDNEMEERARVQLSKAWQALGQQAASMTDDQEEAEAYKLLGEATGQAFMAPGANLERGAAKLVEFAQEQALRTSRKKLQERRQAQHDREMQALFDANAPLETIMQREQAFYEDMYGLNGLRGLGRSTRSRTGSQDGLSVDALLRKGYAKSVQDGLPWTPEEIQERRAEIEAGLNALNGRMGGSQMSPRAEAAYRYQDARQSPDGPGGAFYGGKPPQAGPPAPQPPAPGQMPQGPTPGGDPGPGAAAPPPPPTPPKRPVPQGAKRTNAVTITAQLMAQGFRDADQIAKQLASQGMDAEALMADPTFWEAVKAKMGEAGASNVSGYSENPLKTIYERDIKPGVDYLRETAQSGRAYHSGKRAR